MNALHKCYNAILYYLITKKVAVIYIQYFYGTQMDVLIPSNLDIYTDPFTDLEPSIGTSCEFT